MPAVQPDPGNVDAPTTQPDRQDPPTTQPRPVASADDPREMLENALEAEKQTIDDYLQRIEHAEAFGDVGLKVELENQVADETRHKEELERILAGWERD
jgi:bacterioferritin